MKKDQRFTFICSNDDRHQLAVVAQKLERSQSDVIRWLVHKTARELFSDEGDLGSVYALTLTSTSSVTSADEVAAVQKEDSSNEIAL